MHRFACLIALACLARPACVFGSCFQHERVETIIRVTVLKRKRLIVKGGNTAAICDLGGIKQPVIAINAAIRGSPINHICAGGVLASSV